MFQSYIYQPFACSNSSDLLAFGENKSTEITLLKPYWSIFSQEVWPSSAATCISAHALPLFTLVCILWIRRIGSCLHGFSEAGPLPGGSGSRVSLMYWLSCGQLPEFSDMKCTQPALIFRHIYCDPKNNTGFVCFSRFCLIKYLSILSTWTTFLWATH